MSQAIGQMNPSSINPLWLVAISLIFAAIPLVLGLMTSYLKVSVVLGMLRSALGVQQVPSQLVIMTVSFALSGFIMEPVISASLKIAEGIDRPSGDVPTISEIKKFGRVLEPWRAFMCEHSGARELKVLSDLRSVPSEQPDESTKIKPGCEEFRVLAPAFILSELKSGFTMGFVLLLPFLAIDLIVANILAALGMFMVSPALISLPLKLLIFVSAEGWLLLSKGLIASYQVVGG